MSDRPWVLYGSQPRYSLEIVEIVQRRGEVLEAAIDNLVECESDSALVGQVPVVGRRDLTRFAGRARFVLSAGQGAIRRALHKDLIEAGVEEFPSLVDPTAVVASSSPVGRGTTINALAVVASMTRVGAFVQINRSASIGHDCSLGDFSTIGPGAVLTGFVDIGSGAFIGAGAVIRPRTRIGAGAIVGAGAVVTRDVADSQVVVGNPAIPLVERSGPSREPRR